MINSPNYSDYFTFLERLDDESHEIQLLNDAQHWRLILDGETVARGTDIDECLSEAYEKLVAAPMRAEIDEIP